MDDKKEMLLNLVLKQNVSAIVTMSEKTKSEPEEVIEMLRDLVTEGRLIGSVTEDGSRFFRSDAKVSEAPVIHREDKGPEFLSFDTRPGYITAIIGTLILISGVTVNTYAADQTERDFAGILIFVGALILFAGLFFVAKRKTPS